MRSCFILVALTAGGCSEVATNAAELGPTGSDLAMAASDLSVTAPDLRAALDLGSTADSSSPVDLAAAPDLASTDFARSGDLALTGCAGILTCQAACSPLDFTCAQRCVQDGTSQAQTLYGDLFTCVLVACPNGTGAVCDPTLPPGPCILCRMSAPMSGGACITQYNACLAN